MKTPNKKEELELKQYANFQRIKTELAEINDEYRDKNPYMRDTAFTITHRIEAFINKLNK